MNELSENKFNRLAKAIMEKYRINYSAAIERLNMFRLNVIYNEDVNHVEACQSALVTAVNCGTRAFLGGVYVRFTQMPICKLPGTQNQMPLPEVVSALGGACVEAFSASDSITIVIGPTSIIDPEYMYVYCDGWRAGVGLGSAGVPFTNGVDFSLGGVVAGALGVGNAFLRVSGLDNTAGDQFVGVSLWRPDLKWTAPEAFGPALKRLPRDLWILGLGHLGQAYLWNLALLPYRQESKACFMLQDFDRVVEANVTSGLLCDLDSIGEYKTRVCARWLESSGFNTIITERKFDQSIQRDSDEPRIALCGFDSAIARRCLEGAGFDQIVECGLGNTYRSFDSILMHTFPSNAQKADDIFDSALANSAQVPLDVESLLGSEITDDCGILAKTLAQKAVSASFVGAASGAFVIAELLRGLHGGMRYELINASLRHLENRRCFFQSPYSDEYAKSGYFTLD